MTEPRGELAFIRWIRSQLPSTDPRVTIGPGDDMAELRLPDGGRVLVATDTILDGTHFDARRDPLPDVGWKALAENLSDIAAMAAVPVGAVGTLALPRDFTMAQGQALFAGLKRCADEFDCPWVGGDITSWDQRLAITVTVVAHAERPVRRSGARAGHCVCVTGRLGGSLLGRHLTFRPRLAEARRLSETATVTAMIDLSDGLSTDIHHLCRESGVGVRLEADRVPISDAAVQLAARDGRSPLDHALNDGEDFELLFAVAESDISKVLALDLGVEISVIGRFVPADEGCILIDPQGRTVELKPGGYEHWR